MAVTSSGAISIGDVRTEFLGSSNTSSLSLSQLYRAGGIVPDAAATNFRVPYIGAISLGDFYGATNRVTVSLIINSNTLNYDVYTNAAAAGYVAGLTEVNVTVAPGVIVGSASAPQYAMLVPNAFNPADTVNIINNGSILGVGGNGGAASATAAGAPGSPGGVSLYVNRPVTIVNNGTIAAGGGGGGGGAGGLNPPLKAGTPVSGGGGGGGAGGPGGGGGSPNGGPSPGPAPGAGGGGGGGGIIAAGPGGAGGALGAAGTPGTATPRGGGGGGAGTNNYITGNPFVTWSVTGTRLGGVA